MVDHAAQCYVHPAGGHGTHQIHADIGHGDRGRIDSGVFHHGLCQCFGQGRTAVADGLTGEVCGRGDVFVFEGQYDAQLFLTDRTDGLDRDILFGTRFNDVHGIVDTELCLTGSDQRQGIVLV